MSFNDQRRYKLIEKIKDLINKKLPKDKTQIIIDFTKQFYSSIAVEDLEQRDIEDLYGAILSHWQLISSRKRGETKIRIYNPHYEQHGWQSTHTIIEIVTDDMPFLVDSLRMELNRRGLTTHLIVHFGGMKISRDKLAKATAILPFATPVGDNVVAEAPLYIEIDRQTQAGYLEALKDSLENILKDVRYAVEDWSKMRGKLREALMEIDKKTLSCNPEELSETKDFLRWLENDHFTFLGYREYTVVGKGEEMALSIVPNTGLGVLRGSSTSKSYRAFTSLTPEARKLALSSQILLMSKTNTRATVHRPVYTDYIGIKRFDKDGNLIGERRFIGLYTSVAYHSNPKYIPFVRRKVAMIMKNSGLSPTGHAGKALLNILETYPRDDLFQAPAEELYELAMGVLHLQERKTIRLFARKDIYGRFMSCLVFVPRERFTTELAHAMQGIMQMSFDALEISFSTRFSDSVLAQIHYIVRLDPKSNKTYNLKDIEAKLIEVGRSWQDDLKEHLQDHFGEEKGNELYHKYKSAFPAGYRESFSARTAICDIEHIEASLKSNQLNMSFYHSLEETDKFIRFKLFCPMTPIPLSDALPIFENMGLRVLGERPYLINLLDGKKVWISDFTMIYSGGEVVDIESVKTNFQETFYSVWAGLAENDSFNRLVLSAKLAWREITIIRAIAKYLRQIEFTYSQSYIQDCLNKHAHLAKMLIDFFQYRFNPAKQNNRAAMEAIDTKIKNELDLITLLDEDRIIRIYHEVIHAILRTNYYQTDVEGQAKLYLSFKIEPEKISDLPLPVPMYEIFVYSPRLEGTHLRWAKVARGGIRWSDRREDFRTEILGLMKAQVVKNAVIVPSGAKGGFFPKKLPTNASRDEVMAEVIYCYQTFISALLDLTDNRVGEEIIQPENVISYDETDPYLVVAADKGTATFSDIANEIAARYNYWLKDAFASGGSTGYDHKKIGITARGAWESVKRHFRELNLDIQSQYFSVVGIGDMGGDVFGNGMLLSKHIGLVAAFNHQHIFLDPNPDIEKSYLERQRIFNLTRSSWDDYNRDLLSKGGGIYKRTSKAIKLSSEVKKLLNIKKKDFIVPNDLIKAILRAPVDLLWNGGIGTFIKASSEDNNDVGDRYNDLIRINANELSARVIGEGGNLGLTQLARIEFALNGGCINTDFIDNSGGVDCSDREVNLKILLNGIVENGDLTIKQRNAMLREMEAEIADFVLRNNYSQSQSISIAAHQAQINFDLHNRFTEYLEEQGELDRELEFLPTIAELNDRKTQHKGLTRPEIAVLLAYCKNYIKKKLLNSDVPEDPYLSNVLVFAFPDKIRKQYRQQMESHRLRREIISTLVSNYIVNEMGFTFAYQLENETGATVAEVIRAYSITRNIFELSDIWQQIESFDCLIAADIQIEMMQLVARLVWRSTRWFLRHRRFQTDIENSCEHFKAGINTLHRNIKDWLAGVSQERFNRTRAHLIESGVAEELAEKVATKQALISALDIVDATFEYQFELEEVARTYFKLSEVLELGWFREQLYAQNVDNQWEALAREACRDDLDWQQKGLTIAVLKQGQRKQSITERITNWLDTNQHLLVRWQAMLAKLKSQTSHNYVMFTVGLRELMDLTQSALQSAGQEDIMLVANRIDPKFSGVTPKLESAVKISKLKDKSELIANNKQKKTQKAKEK